MKVNNPVDCCSEASLKPFNQALETILAAMAPITETELVSLENCLDRILAEDMLSNSMHPPWNCSAMDGYALKSSSYQPDQPLSMVGASFAGHPYQGKVVAGECIRIMTGACLPDDCDVVVMQENVRADGKNIHLQSSPEQWLHVRKVGTEVAIGEILLKRGQQVNPRNISIIASLGLKEIQVFRQLKVAVFSTGDELVQACGSLRTGQIFDSNRYAIIAICKRLGYQVIDLGLIADDQEKIKQVMLEAASMADVLLTSGGVSVGEADYVKPIVEEIGQIDLWKVAIKPGKPIAIGSIKQCKFFGLPGNPVSAMVTLNLLVQPAMQKLSGRDLVPATIISAICGSKLSKKAGRRDYQRGFAYSDQQGNWQVKSTGSQGSAKLTSLSDANCYIVLAENSTNISVGDTVNIQFFDEIIR